MPKYYEVSKVLAVRTVDGHKEYLLRWKGYGSRADSWVRENDCNSAIKNFAATTIEGELIVSQLRMTARMSLILFGVYSKSYLFSFVYFSQAKNRQLLGV